MYAIIEDSGAQIKVRQGDILDIDLRSDADKQPKTLTFDRVLLVGDDGDDKAGKVGVPYVKGATVTADVLDEIAGEKIDVIKFKRRKGYRRKTGHRQRYLRVKITSVKA